MTHKSTSLLFCACAAALALLSYSAQAASRTPTVNELAPEMSPEMAKSVCAPAFPLWATPASGAEEVSKAARAFAAAGAKTALDLARRMNVVIESGNIADVPIFTLTPKELSGKKADKIVYYLHGGGYVLGHGVAGTAEAVQLAGREGWKVICVDYRMAPEYPFPAAIEDAFAVYRELVKEHGANNIAVFGTSTGGAMTLILALQAHEAKVAMPAALIAGTPWADMGRIGDTYYTNDGIDNVLHSYDGLLKAAVKTYAGAEDLKNPLISPVYAKDEALCEFPSTLLISGTRDLFLSNTVRMQRRLLLNDVDVDLIVYESMSHAQYYINPAARETGEHYSFLNAFLERVLLKK